MADVAKRRDLWLYNSLGKSKTKFVPLDPRGKSVTWYCCGPTVYDAGHLGHARNYVTTDILRRIMRDYLGYDVEFVMNITDVDDKIILRARQQHLLAAFRNQHATIDQEVVQTAHSAFSAYANKNLPLLPEALTPETYDAEVQTKYGAVLGNGGTLTGQGTPGDAEAKIKMHHKILSTASRALSQSPPPIADIFYDSASDVLLPFLDGLHGSTISSSDYTIFSQLTQHWEKKFRQDLSLLNCLPPTITTRVSEFITEIVTFVVQIEKRGFAYATSDGSVYFDIAAFEAAGNSYARLEPWNRNDKSLQADGEGSLTKRSTEKRSDADFALWKASKAGEPSWDSPWGKGRPGWHIECSAMASEVLGGKIDIHSGGIDLAFPHHDNELAQSEAYWVEPSSCKESHKQHDWINYFLHMGHLSIAGSKMSKSLKNFTTIDDALNNKAKGGWTARSLRIVFLLGGWDKRIEVTDDVVARANAWERTIDNFFTTTKAMLDEQAALEGTGKIIPHLFRDPERQLRTDLRLAQISLDDALLDSFNTPLAMTCLEDLISRSNQYLTAIARPPFSAQPSSLALLAEVARWLTRMITIFGLNPSGSTGGDPIGWSPAAASSASSASNAISDDLLPFARSVSTYRDSIRLLALTLPPEPKSELLTLSDTLRDTSFLSLGLSLDDRAPGQPALLKQVPVAELLAARDRKIAEQAAAARKKESARLERERLEQQKAEKGKVDPREMFRTADWADWDDEGVPLREKDGTEVTQSKRKKLRKDWERQKKAHEAWLASASQTSTKPGTE